MLPSKQEGRGLPLLEACAVEVPILTSRYKPKAVFKEVIGKHYCLSRDKKDLQQLTDKFNKALSGEKVPSQLVNRKCKDGSVGKHILSINPVYEDTKIVGMEGFILDITDLDVEKKIT